MSGIETPFEIVEKADGYEVCRIERVVLGTFPARKLAQIFKVALQAQEKLDRDGDEAEVRLDAAFVSARAQKEAPLQAETASVPPHQAASTSGTAPEPTPKPEAAEVQRLTAATHPELFEKAAAQLIEGKQMSRVADDLGIPFGRLRGWWASQSRFRPTPREETVPERPAEVRRGRRAWSDEEDDRILAAFRSNNPQAVLEAFAIETGRTMAEVEARGEALIKMGMPE